MKKLNLLIVALLMITIYAGCKKNDAATSTPAATTASDNYTSMAAFHAQNGVPMQTFTINAATGGSYTTPQGTVVTIPANAFQTQAGGVVTGNVTIQFKDIYKKSDMLLSDKGTKYYDGTPLRSGGEFFIKAMQSNAALELVIGKKISVSQPRSQMGVLDTAMVPMIAVDTTGLNQPLWFPNPTDSLSLSTNNYIFSLYQMNNPLDSGSWCNSDQAYFTGFTQTSLTLHPVDLVTIYSTQVYLLFSNMNSMVHVYYDGTTNFPYTFAPLNAQCTIVAVGVKNGKLYSSFTPITITNNLTVNFTLSETTTADFKTRLNTLN